MKTHTIKGLSQDSHRGKIFFDARAELIVEDKDQCIFLEKIASMVLDEMAHPKDFIIEYSHRALKEVPFIVKMGQLYKKENFSRLIEIEIPLIPDFSIHVDSPPSISLRGFSSHQEEEVAFFIRNEKGEYSCFKKSEENSGLGDSSIGWKDLDNRGSFERVFKAESVSYILGRIKARIEKEKEDVPSHNHYEIEHYEEQLEYFEQLLSNAEKINYYEDILDLSFKKRPVSSSIPEGFNPEETIEGRAERIRRTRENITFERSLEQIRSQSSISSFRQEREAYISSLLP